MASFNKVILVGNLTRDPELRSFASGSVVCVVGLAVNERRKDQNGAWVEEAHFFDVDVWNRNAEILKEYCKKGSCILVEGKLRQDTWEQDGQKRSKVKVFAERIVLLGGRGDGGNSSEQGRGGYAQRRSQGGSQGSEQSFGGGYSSGPTDADYIGPGASPRDSGFTPDPGDDIPF
ncbi:MAG: single-stranded DNA-binding protein [Planctomycetia bacterium]|nr:single-stranded DNA-binding protein [Planctomycetia bacterium]